MGNAYLKTPSFMSRIVFAGADCEFMAHMANILSRIVLMSPKVLIIQFAM
jgi:hypothetical protein